MAKISKFIKPKFVEARLSYTLSFKQSEISKEVKEEKKEIYVDAVCGAGKT